MSKKPDLKAQLRHPPGWEDLDEPARPPGAAPVDEQAELAPQPDDDELDSLNFRVRRRMKRRLRAQVRRLEAEKESYLYEWLMGDALDRLERGEIEPPASVLSAKSRKGKP